MENKIVEFNINFGGFYESIHSHIIDTAIANYFDCDDIYDVDENLIDQVDIKAMQDDYAQQWLELYKEVIPFGVGFVRIDSPDYYNFETDKITARISEKKVDDLINTLQDNWEFVEWLDENSQSYDGFHSWYVGFDQVKENKAVFMMYYTDYISEQHKDDMEYFFDQIWADIVLLEKRGV